MNRGTLLKVCAVCALALAMFSFGCAHTISSESTRVRQVAWQAELDECQEILLSVSQVYDSENGAVLGSREELTLEVRPRSDLQYESLLKSVEVKRGAQADELRYDGIEVRADATRRRVWFVDVAAQRVIATLDRDTRTATGPDDEAPSWAIVDGGVLLEAGE